MTIRVTARRMFSSIVFLGISSVFSLSALTLIVSVFEQRLTNFAFVAVLALIALLFFNDSTYGNAHLAFLFAEPIGEVAKNCLHDVVNLSLGKLRLRN